MATCCTNLEQKKDVKGMCMGERLLYEVIVKKKLKKKWKL